VPGVRVRDFGASLSARGRGCLPSGNEVVCATGVRRVAVDLGDDDSADHRNRTAPVDASVGHVARDDGEAGDVTGVETVNGGRAGDTISQVPGRNTWTVGASSLTCPGAPKKASPARPCSPGAGSPPASPKRAR
jgi:hypothetical protein